MKYNVLIADDSEMTRHIIRRDLGLSGLDLETIHEAGNGEAAWEILSKERIDLALVDISMPVLTGGELVDRMKNGNMLERTCVLIVSSHRNEDVINDLLDRGAHGFLSKPFTPEEFIARVKQELSKMQSETS